MNARDRTKILLAGAIANEVALRDLTQLQAAGLLGVTQPQISRIVNKKLEDISIASLLNYCEVLDIEVNVEVK